LCSARELTKKFEEFLRGTPAELLEIPQRSDRSTASLWCREQEQTGRKDTKTDTKDTDDCQRRFLSVSICGFLP